MLPHPDLQASFMVQANEHLRGSGAPDFALPLLNVFNDWNKAPGTLCANTESSKEWQMINQDKVFGIVPRREQWASANQAYLESLSQDADMVISAADRLLALNITAEKSVLTDSLTQAKLLLDARNARELLALCCHVGRPGFEKTLTYGCVLYDLLAQIQTQAWRLAEIRSGGMKEILEEAATETASADPPASTAGLDAARSFSSLAQFSLDAMKSTSRQVAAMMERNVAAMTLASVQISNAANNEVESILRASS